MKLKNRKTALVKTLVMLLVLIFTLTYASFSWIKREWSPKIEQENISIATSGALVFQFTDYGNEVTTTKSVNEILGVSDFSLKPVSSASGKAGEFFSLEYADEVGLETFKHLDYLAEGVSNESAMGIRHGYIVLNFKLMLASLEGDEERRYVYLNPSSHIAPANEDNDVTSAIRISIYSEQAGIDPIIVGTRTAKEKDCYGVTNVKDANQNFVADGEKLFDYYSEEDASLSIRNEQSESGDDLLERQTVKAMDEYDCVDENGVFKESEALFVIEPRKAINVTVCIWLEGEDPLCNDSITESQINLLLQFSARTVAGNN